MKILFDDADFDLDTPDVIEHILQYMNDAPASPRMARRGKMYWISRSIFLNDRIRLWSNNDYAIFNLPTSPENHNKIRMGLRGFVWGDEFIALDGVSHEHVIANDVFDSVMWTAFDDIVHVTNEEDAMRVRMAL